MKTTKPPQSPTSSSSHLWFFFCLALGWSWLFWISAILLGFSVESIEGIVLGLLGLLGPLIAGISSTYLTYGREGRRDYWVRIIDVRRIGVRWYIVVFLFVPCLIALAAALDVLSGGNGAAWEEAALQIFAAPWTIIPFALTIFFVGPMEELGWRGYALDRLQERWNALASSLVLGVVWSVWHLPLFFFPDTYQYDLGAGSLSFWLFMTGIVPLTVVFTWIFNNTRRSTLAAILFHFMVNFTGELVALAPRAEVYSILLWFGAAAVVTAIWGAETLAGRRKAGLGDTVQVRRMS